MSRNQICAQCEFFTLKDENGPLPQAAHGIGRCHGYDGHVAPVEPFVRWDAPYCVHFGRAKDWQKREQWIQQKRDADSQANAAAACAQPQGDANGGDRLQRGAPIEINSTVRL